MSYRATSRRTRLLSGAATGLALILAAGAVNAQTLPEADDEEAVEEVVVTGIRAGIESSIAAKRNETSIVEVVSAEDIGKLPDVSIAESIARLPGLAAQRLNGRAQSISVRGLGPDFTTALLNGREQVTAGDNRGVEFDQYPSELLSSVVIYKTPDATLLGQGLAGTADLRTVRPLAYGKRALSIGARYEFNDLEELNAGAETTGERFNISYIDQFMDDKVGIAVGYAHVSTPYQAERFNSWGYPTTAGGAAVIGGAKPYVQSSVLERDGYFGTLELRPNDRVKSSVDVFYSQFKFQENLRGIELPLFWGGSSGACADGQTTQTATCRPAPQLINPTVSNGRVTAGTFTNVKGVVRNDANTRDSDLFAIGWNTEVEFADNWTAELDVSRSQVRREDVILETYSGTGNNVAGALDTIAFRTSADEGTIFTPTLNYADYNLIRLTSPQGWGGDVIPGGQLGYYNSPSIDDELNALRLSVTRDFADGFFLRNVEIGANYTGREKTFVANEFFLGLGGGQTNIAIPESARVGITNLSFLGIGGMASYDPFALIDAGVFQLVRNPNGDVKAKDWYVRENVTTGYVQANIDTMLGSIPLTGNVGLQVVKTEQFSRAFAATGAGTSTVTVPVSGGAEYTDYLPSANLIFEFPASTYLRLAAARTLARPRMDEMRASFTYNFDASRVNLQPPGLPTSPWSGNGGNPQLEPWRADAYDISVEKYFGGRRGYVALAGFYKDLKNYIYSQNEVIDFSGFPTGGVQNNNTSLGFVSTPQNGEGGVIKGVEFTFSAPLDLFFSPLEGFGVYFSATKNESEIQFRGPGSPATALPGLSEEIVNSTIYYERAGFQARVSSRYRSDFLGEVAVFGNGRGNRFVKSENVVDAQIGYAFESGSLEGLSLVLQANNLTDEPFSTYEEGRAGQVIDYQRYGRTFLVGANYRF